MKIILLGIACLVICGCDSDPVQKQIDRETPQQSKALEQTVAAFSEMLDKGAVPGMAKSDLVSLNAVPVGDEASFHTYPRTANIKVDSNSSPGWLLNYQFQQKSQDAKWSLVDAWKQNKTSGEKMSLMSAPK